MTDTRSWWPEGYGDDPAFQVRRQVYGPVTGGDYTRGSGVLTLQHTALRYPTEIPGEATALGRAVLHVRVKDHGILKQPVLENGVQISHLNIPIGTIEITWGWPASLQDTWLEVALVRSAFGRPSTVNDGETIMSGTRDAFFQYDQAHKPVLDEDGKNVLVTPPLVDDKLLPPGRWYHYGLFFKISEVKWIQGMVDSTLLPRDFHHDQILWNHIPPYYRWTDENSLIGQGYLQQFLNVFAFELDTAREYVESWQHTYDVDWSPIRLLRKLGDNFGYPYEQGVGDIRYRSLFSELGRFYETRGTPKCLEGVIERMSKFQCSVTRGSNLMLLPSDSDFTTVTGNWGGPHPAVDTPGTPLPYDRITLAVADTKVTGVSPPTKPAPDNSMIGRGVMSVTSAKADVGADLAIVCGCGYVWDGSAYQEVLPVAGGIPVEPGMSYGFSVYIQPAVAPVNPQLSLLWFDGSGVPTGYISASSGIVDLAEASGVWERFNLGIMVPPPADAVYVVPYILFDIRTDSGAYTTTAPPIYIASPMVYAAPAIGEDTGPPPNQFLTISDPSEPLGGPLTYKGALTGAATALPTVHATNDFYTLTPAPVPTAAPQFAGVTPARAAQVNDAIYWTGTAWKNIGPIPSTFQPYLLGSPEGAPR